MSGIAKLRKKVLVPVEKRFQTIDVKSMVALKSKGLEMSKLVEIFNVPVETIKKVYASYTTWATQMAEELNELNNE